MTPMANEFQDLKSGLTILQHGIDVWTKFEQLIQYLESGSTSKYQHPLPDWILEHRDSLLAEANPYLSEIETYLVYHDCGKPFCLFTDEQGRRHFPNHADVSKNTFLKYSHNHFIADLIGKDMFCHITKPKDYKTLLNEPCIEILLLAGIASIHANAGMFGGFESDSFKIKFKNLDHLGKRILNDKYKNTQVPHTSFTSQPQLTF